MGSNLLVFTVRMTVAPPLSAGLITMLLFAVSSLSALSCAVSMFFFVGLVGTLSYRPIAFIVITVSRLLLPTGGLYLLNDWSLRQLVSLKGPILVPSVALAVSSLK